MRAAVGAAGLRRGGALLGGGLLDQVLGGGVGVHAVRQLGGQLGVAGFCAVNRVAHPVGDHRVQDFMPGGAGLAGQQVARALELLQQSVPVWLCRHSLRTWAWSTLLAQRDALKQDAEVLAVSCLLHDIALLPNGRPPASLRCACFAIDGGQRARRFLQEQGWADSRALAVENAICLHMNPRVPPGAGIEAHLLQQAAAMDVVGARANGIDAASRHAVLSRYPRTGFAQRMSEAMRLQAERAPDTRTRLLWRMGFERAIRRSVWHG